MSESRAAWEKIEKARSLRPNNRRWLWNWVKNYTGIRIPREPVCIGHCAPFEPFSRQVLERPAISLTHAPRGGGKSFSSALETHITSRFHPGSETAILGGSKAQSQQIYKAIKIIARNGAGPFGHSDGDTIDTMLAQSIRYFNEAEVSNLAASSTSVRGPHVASLKLDEVDEIAPDIRESALGMSMRKGDLSASIQMTSTWHKPNGPMAELIERGRVGGEFPVYSFCMFEVLERCPEERSGHSLENCPQCPLVQWCHADRDQHPSGLPKAKRSDGHYAIDALIQKVKLASLRIFESDYLCLRPRVTGVWFSQFAEHKHVTKAAEYDPSLPVHLAIDPGVHTGAVWFQVRQWPNGSIRVNVFGDYYLETSTSEMAPAERNARAILEQTRALCGSANVNGRLRVSLDSAGKARSMSGPVLRGEYERVGLRGRNGIEYWQVTGKLQGLQLVEALLMAADGTVALTIHPRCRHLIMAFLGYCRGTKNNQWLDMPDDPQHPSEDLIDPLCGGLKLEFAEGRTPPPQFKTRHAGSLI